ARPGAPAVTVPVTSTPASLTVRVDATGVLAVIVNVVPHGQRPLQQPPAQQAPPPTAAPPPAAAGPAAAGTVVLNGQLASAPLNATTGPPAAAPAAPGPPPQAAVPSPAPTPRPAPARAGIASARRCGAAP